MARPKTLQRTLPGLGRILRYFWPWIRREKPLMASSMAALFAGVVLSLAEPWPLKIILDRVILGRTLEGSGPTPLDGFTPLTLLTGAAVAIVAIGGLRALAAYHQRISLAKLGNRVLRSVREHVFLHLQSLPIAFHTRSRTGDLIFRITRDVSMLRDVASTAMFPLLANILVLAGMVVVMLLLEWRLALLALTTAPLFWLSMSRLGRGIHRAARKQREREGAMAATAVESIAAIRDVQALSLQDTFAGEFATRNAMGQKQDLKAAKLSAKLTRTVDVLLALATAMVLWYGALLVLRGSLTPGALLVFLAYLRRAFRPARDFAKHTGRLAKATAAGERVLDLVAVVPEIRDSPDAVTAPAFAGTVDLVGVSFAYESGQQVLDTVNAHLSPGECLVLAGPSGSGKSTLISLLLRLYDPTAGSIRIDGRDLREYTLDSLRPQISVVQQDASLFAASIRENIAFGLENVSEHSLREAARAAQAHRFIERLPEGYDTVVGERGQTLSRGQRQRLAIARAFLRRAPLLILDEPTTGLDARNAGNVVDTLRRLRRGVTTIIATHDPQLMALGQHVLRLAHGRSPAIEVVGAPSGPPGELTLAQEHP